MSEHEEVMVEPIRAKPRRSRLGMVLIAAALLVCAAAASVFAYGRQVSAPVSTALQGEKAGLDTIVYRRHWLSSSEIVFDVRGTNGEASMVDVTRHLLKSAEALKMRHFERIYLASRGREKFFLDGAYFQRIGEERSWQNPIYTIRTMPENVMALDGAKAFAGWTGGWLGVMGKQMEDNAEFHKQWWVNDALEHMTR